MTKNEKEYESSKQKTGAQVFDSIFLLVLVYAALLLPLVSGIATPGPVPIEQKGTPNRESLHQNPTPWHSKVATNNNVNIVAPARPTRGG